MKIIIETPPDGAEDEIIIRCRNLDDEMIKLIFNIKMQRESLIAYKNEQLYRINPLDIYYFESIDNHTYLYCKNDVYEFKKKLYQIEEIFSNGDFLRISKSVILNLTKIDSIVPAFNGRFEAILDNGEKTIISRQYVPMLKKKLRI
ncbi:TPA: LytTR family DNA-binding domain-containing protein [Clostridioides difficile]|uniref:LytTR family DNA-binding domain-containing protein n=1 Tax=Clostridioides difficile TaxID=1496 RepID=UPI00038D649E|nr:LytTR family DNA-binding domain-containing protein [Clostridioides difficile]OFU12058.1 histidine kinase [Clostridium sp. HMSC19C11]HBR0068536.1 LytTR family transcriptional regulator [Klebsiella pneumoniae]EQE18169.1 lytTr DNA-binding domain protein [Clostridioides difficile CD18]EQG31149.1 lytTr DNA-binding domain protein [Clostridioides difficile DA00129]EQJ13801.1 lytTr DNA-binding domain protein [Clostridioides difficile P9]